MPVIEPKSKIPPGKHAAPAPTRQLAKAPPTKPVVGAAQQQIQKNAEAAKQEAARRGQSANTKPSTAAIAHAAITGSGQGQASHRPGPNQMRQAPQSSVPHTQVAHTTSAAPSASNAVIEHHAAVQAPESPLHPLPKHEVSAPSESATASTAAVAATATTVATTATAVAVPVVGTDSASVQLTFTCPVCKNKHIVSFG